MTLIDLRADLNAEDDEGRWWSLLSDSIHPDRVQPGALLIAGTKRYWSVVRIDQADNGGQVHFVGLPADDPAAAELLARTEGTST